MSTALGRGMRILELLAASPQGVMLGEVSGTLGIPASATHRLLTEFTELGYVRSGGDGTYALGMKAITLALGYLSEVDLVDLAKGSVDRIAAASGGLARLGLVDEQSMTWVLKSQGSTSHIRYEPPINYDVQLSCSASGHAWLSRLSDDEALELLLAQGVPGEGFGPKAPRTVEEVFELLRRVRKRGYAQVTDMYEEGITTVAVPIVGKQTRTVTGVLSVAGLNAAMSEDRIAGFLPLLMAEAAELATARLDYAKYLLPAGEARATGRRTG